MVNIDKSYEVLNEKYPYRTISSMLKGAIGPEDKTHGKCHKCGKTLPLILGGKVNALNVVGNFML